MSTGAELGQYHIFCKRAIQKHSEDSMHVYAMLSSSTVIWIYAFLFLLERNEMKRMNQRMKN